MQGQTQLSYFVDPDIEFPRADWRVRRQSDESTSWPWTATLKIDDLDFFLGVPEDRRHDIGWALMWIGQHLVMEREGKGDDTPRSLVPVNEGEA